jgi:hypothetical protein
MLLIGWATLASGSSNVVIAGEPLRWQGPVGERPYIPVAVNATNDAGLSPEEIRLAVVHAFLSWQAASGDAFDFDVWVGVDPSWYPTGQRADGYTTVSFASAAPTAALGDWVAGHTALFYDETGWVLEGDIVVNDLPFELTRDPTQTNYAESGWATKTLYLDDIVTHEVGHLLGLGHTGVSTSTMFAGAWAGQSTLGCDDVNGMHELYTPGTGGTVSGRIEIAGLGGASGLEVYAIGVDSRSVRAAAFTDAQGDYAITGLPDDDYVLVAGEYGGNPDGLPVQLSETYVQPCAISRAVYGDGEAVPVRGDDVGASWSVSCGGGISLPEDPGLRERPIDVQAIEGLDGTHIALAERVPTETGTWLALPDLPGPLSLDILSWSLFSPARVEVQLFDSLGVPLEARVVVPLVEHADAPVWDTRIEADELPPGGALLYLTATALSSASYPGGRDYLDGDPFAVVVGHLGEEVHLPEDCAPRVDPGATVAPGGHPARSALPPPRGVGGCATGPAPSPLLGLVLGALAVRRRR